MEESFTVHSGSENYKVTPVYLKDNKLRFEICLHGEIFFWMEQYINLYGNEEWKIVNDGNLKTPSALQMEDIGFKIDDHFE